MPRLTPISSKSDVPAAHQAVADDVMKVFGRIRGPYSMLLHAPNLAKKLLPLVPFFRDECMVEAPLRSLAIITAVRECEAAYVWAAQVAAARRNGVSEDTIQVVKSKGDPAKLPDDERDVLRANLIFPNVPTSSSESQWMTYQVVPTGPETSLLDIRIRGERGGPPLDDESVAQLLRVLRDEDGGAVEQIQRVLRSPRFEVGPLAAHHEAPITRFQRNVVEHLA